MNELRVTGTNNGDRVMVSAMRHAVETGISCILKSEACFFGIRTGIACTTHKRPISKRDNPTSTAGNPARLGRCYFTNRIASAIT